MTYTIRVAGIVLSLWRDGSDVIVSTGLFSWRLSRDEINELRDDLEAVLGKLFKEEVENNGKI